MQQKKFQDGAFLISLRGHIWMVWLNNGEQYVWEILARISETRNA